MRRKSRFLILTPIVCWAFFYLSKDATAGPHTYQSLNYVRKCQILNYDGVVLKSFPGDFCLFLNNGSFVSASIDGLTLFDKESRKIWRLQGHFHHQMSFTLDNKFILALSSYFEDGQNRVRRDRLLKIDLEGHIVSESKSAWLFSEVKFDFPEWSFRKPIDGQIVPFERSHFNSIYEIPENLKSTKFNYLAKGGIVVNSVSAGVFILSSDLKKVLAHWIFKHSKGHHVHDVQVTKEGQLIYFNNKNADDEKGPYSSIEVWDPTSEKIFWKYTSDPKQFFYSAAAGAVQVLDNDTLFFNDHERGAFFVKKKSKKLISSNQYLFFEQITAPSPMKLQMIKALNLKSFLENWK